MTKKIKTILIIFFVFIFYVLLVELISRLTIYLTSSEKKVFIYGINKNIEIEIVDLSDFKFNVNDINKDNIKIETERKKSDTKGQNPANYIIWTFGASLTYGYSCGEDSSSWPRELENLNSNFKIINYGFPSIYSDDSIKILNHNLKNVTNNKPDIIIWAHRDEEKKPIYYGLKRNKKKIKKNFSFKKKTKKYYLFKINETFKSNLASYLVLNHIVEKIKKKNNVYQENVIRVSDLSDSDYLIAIENYSINTKDANDLSKSYGVKNFIIVSLFDETQNNLQNNNSFLKFYNNEVKNIARDHNNIKFIDTFTYLDESNKKEITSYFCSNKNKHYNLKGNELIAKIIYNFIKK